MSSVEFRNVWKIYGDEVVAVRDANFKCNSGEFITILGPSGCGKSSSLRMIAGLEEVSKGSIFFGEKMVNDLTPHERNIALAFESYALYSPLTIFDNIAFPLRVRGHAKGEIKSTVLEIAEAMELMDVLDRKPAALSGGQKQRVSLARALVREPNVFLLDEPLSHMDQAVRSTLRARIRHIHDHSKATTIYVTHDQEEAVALSDRVIVMNLATIQQMGTVDEIYNRPCNEFVAGFVGDPRMNFLDGEMETESKISVIGNDERVTVNLPRKVKEYAPGQNVLLGIRPEKMIISESPVEGYLKANIELVEFVGDYKLFTFKVVERNIKAMTSIEVSLQKSVDVFIGFEAENINVFDKKSGEAII